MVSKVRAAATDRKREVVRMCWLEALAEKPSAREDAPLLSLLAPKVVPESRHEVARILGEGTLDAATRTKLADLLKDKTLVHDASLALLFGGDDASLAAIFQAYTPKTEEDAPPPPPIGSLRQLYAQSVPVVTEELYDSGALARMARNAVAARAITIAGAKQDWVLQGLSYQLRQNEFDNGPHTLTRVRLPREARRGRERPRRSQARRRDAPFVGARRARDARVPGRRCEGAPRGVAALKKIVLVLVAIACGGPAATTKTAANIAVSHIEAPYGVTLVEACTPTGPEICFNAVDDNCNGVIDEGCGIATGPLQFTIAWGDNPADVDLARHRSRAASSSTPRTQRTAPSASASTAIAPRTRATARTSTTSSGPASTRRAAATPSTSSSPISTAPRCPSTSASAPASAAAATAPTSRSKRKTTRNTSCSPLIGHTSASSEKFSRRRFDNETSFPPGRFLRDLGKEKSARELRAICLVRRYPGSGRERSRTLRRATLA